MPPTQNTQVCFSSFFFQLFFFGKTWFSMVSTCRGYTSCSVSVAILLLSKESTWKASYDPSFVKVSVAKGKTKLLDSEELINPLFINMGCPWF